MLSSGDTFCIITHNLMQLPKPNTCLTSFVGKWSPSKLSGLSLHWILLFWISQFKNGFYSQNTPCMLNVIFPVDYTSVPDTNTKTCRSIADTFPFCCCFLGRWCVIASFRSWWWGVIIAAIFQFSLCRLFLQRGLVATLFFPSATCKQSKSVIKLSWLSRFHK